MLNSLRGSGQSKTMWIIMGLLMLGLTGFGLGGLGGGTIRNIGTVGKEEIPINTYARAYRNATARLSQQAGRNLSPVELQLFGVQEQVLDAVISQTALNDETTSRGISVGDELVRKSILTNPQFQGLDGSFDQESYDFFLERQMGLSAPEFETLLRKENARGILESSVVGGVSGSDVQAMTLIQFAQQERSFEWAALSENSLGEKIGEPSDAELEAFYNEFSADYMSPRKRNIAYAWLNPTDLIEQVDVDEAQIRESYDLQSDRFDRQELRALDRVVFPTLADAQSARDRLDAQSVSFSEVVTERGLTDSDVDLGEIGRNSLTKEAAEVVFAEDGPGVVGPVESALGPALFRINAIMAADNTTFEEAREELRGELAGEAARRLVGDRASEIDDLLAGGAELEELAGEIGMQLGTIGYFAESEEPLAAYDKFREVANDTKVGDFPELFYLSDGGVFTLRLDEIVEPAQISLAEIRDRVVADWHATEVNKALIALAERLKPGMENGGNLMFIGVEMTPVDGINRSSFVEAVPPSTVSEVFKLDLGKVAVVDAGGAVLLVRVTNITDFDPDLNDNDVLLGRVEEQIDAQVSLDLLEYFSKDIQNSKGVQLNTAAINQVNAQVNGQ